jgi:hypothetical protein
MKYFCMNALKTLPPVQLEHVLGLFLLILYIE